MHMPHSSSPFGLRRRPRATGGLLWALLLAFALTLAASATASAREPLFSKLASEPTTLRVGADSAVLPGGELLITGGEAGGGLAGSAEAFDPTTRHFQGLGSSPAVERARAMAATLADGEVLIAGGVGVERDGFGRRLALKSAELFDPVTGTFQAIPGELHTVRSGATATLLPNGKVLIAGGEANETPLASAELFDPGTDPSTGTFETLPSEMTVSRTLPTASALPSGDVIIAGGVHAAKALETAELFDPTNGTFAPLPAHMYVGRAGGVSVTLPGGNILLAGGTAGSSTEIFDPETQAFERVSGEMTGPRQQFVGAALPDGGVMLGAGQFTTAEVSIPLVAAAQISGAAFGDQPAGQSSATSKLVVTSVGPIPLAVTGATLGGADAASFHVTQETCPAVRLELNEACTIGVSFRPTGAGAASATLTLSDNEAAPAQIPLTGTGVARESAATGPAGTAGEAGATGPAGASGAAGPEGASGAAGIVGPTGSAGTPGRSGAQPQAATVRLLICTSSTTNVKHRQPRVQRCVSRLVARPSSFWTKLWTAKATVSSGGHTLATGTTTTLEGHTEFLSDTAGALRPGRYALVVTRGAGKHASTTHSTITVVG